MKIEFDKKWFEDKIAKEGDCEIGAGSLEFVKQLPETIIRSDTNNMKTRDINIAVGIELGGKWYYNPKAQTPHKIFVAGDAYVSHFQDLAEVPSDLELPERDLSFIRDYTSSADYCTEFEKTLTDSDRAIYTCILQEILDLTGTFKAIAGLVFCTPLQRCMAFLKLRGKWKD